MKRITVIHPSVRLRRLALLAAAAAVLLLLLGFSGGQRSVRGKTNRERIGYLNSLGWETEGSPASEKEIELPEEFPQVLLNYNELLKQRGFDLTKYAGKKVQMYTYRITNYPGEDNVYCSLYVCRGRIVGGDLHSTAFEGFMLPLTARENDKNG